MANTTSPDDFPDFDAWQSARIDEIESRMRREVADRQQADYHAAKFEHIMSRARNKLASATVVPVMEPSNSDLQADIAEVRAQVLRLTAKSDNHDASIVELSRSLDRNTEAQRLMIDAINGLATEVGNLRSFLERQQG